MKNKIRYIFGLAFSLLLTFSLLGIGLSSPALAAANGTTGGALSLASTIENISVIFPFTGDDDGDNQAALYYRQTGASSWTPGIAMTADRRSTLSLYGAGTITNTYKNQWRAIVFNLTPNTSYDVKVEYTDADGGSGTAQGTITTWNDNPASSGNTYYVATTGNDTTGNGSAGSPWKTISKAAGVVNPGDTVRIMPGTYNANTGITRSGTVNNYITFVSDDLNNKATITYTNCPNRGVFYLNNVSYVRIKGLNISAQGEGDEDVYITGNSVGNIVEDCNLSVGGSISWWTGCIYVDGSGTSNGPSYTLIQRNTLTSTVASSSSASGEGPNGIMLYTTGGGTVVRDNTITGNWQDGVSGANNFEVEGGPRFNSYIYRNTITGQYDDGIEAEGGGINCAVWGNICNVTGGNMSFASAPVIVGPMYVFRNVFTLNGYYTASNIKLGSSSYGYTYFYNNTIYGAYATNNVPCVASNGSDNNIQNIVFRNNIIQNANGGSHTVLGEWTSAVNISYDYDNMYAPGSGEPIEYKGTNYNWTNFKSAGQEAHGVWGQNTFVNASTYDMHLRSTDPAIDKGVVIAGFNDANSAWPYSGSAPDMGAYEYASGPSSPSITTGSLSSGDVGAAYSQTLSATGGTSPYTWAVSSGSLPAGLALNAATGVISGTPTSAGTTSVTFKVTDSASKTATAVLTITVSAANSAPAASGDTYTTSTNTALSISAPGVLSNDTDANGDTLTAVLASSASHGSLSLNSNGSFTYTPTTGYTGNDSFTYKANDGKTNSGTATVTITVSAPAAALVANNYSYSVVQGDVLTVNQPGVLANYSSGGSLATVLVTTVSHCSLSLNADGSFVYNSSADYSGLDNFTYKISNGTAESNVGTVTITVLPKASIEPVTATFGLDSGNKTMKDYPNTIELERFCNTAGTGTLTKLEVLFSTNSPKGKIRLGIYADANGKPGALLLDAGEVTVTNGWVSVSGLNLPVTQGTYYWLAFNTQYQNNVTYVTGQANKSHYSIYAWYGSLPSRLNISYWTQGNSTQYVMRATVQTGN